MLWNYKRVNRCKSDVSRNPPQGCSEWMQTSARLRLGMWPRLMNYGYRHVSHRNWEVNKRTQSNYHDCCTNAFYARLSVVGSLPLKYAENDLQERIWRWRAKVCEFQCASWHITVVRGYALLDECTKIPRDKEVMRGKLKKSTNRKEMK